MVKTPSYVRDNIHVSQLAKVYVHNRWDARRPQTDFSKPGVRLDTDVVDVEARGWYEQLAWDGKGLSGSCPAHCGYEIAEDEHQMDRLPSFLIIGAMKSATSTLYEQLLRQSGIFLPRLKEPNFFSNDEQFARGIEWYSGLFKEAGPADILGEASTHYTKLPTYPHSVARMRDLLTQPRLIYVMRDPIDRLISQYIHQWSEREIRCGLDQALTRHPELIAYSCYARQLAPFIEAYGKAAILPVFFDRLLANPQGELERVCRFIGYGREVKWDEARSRSNVSAQRVRKFPLYDLIVEHPIAARLRRGLFPKALRTKVRRFLSMEARPAVAETTRKELEKRFDDDLAILGDWLGVSLNCRNFRAITSTQSLDWR